MDQLRAHRWPGNVRELRNWVEATVAMGERPELASQEANDKTSGSAEGSISHLSYKDARRTVLEDFERRYLTQLLADASGNVALAARKAQMDRTYLIKLVQRHGIRAR
jgi:DNA-binding NtrC family response regulator